MDSLGFPRNPPGIGGGVLSTAALVVIGIALLSMSEEETRAREMANSEETDVYLHVFTSSSPFWETDTIAKIS